MKKEISNLLKRKHIDKAAEQWDNSKIIKLIDEVENFVYDFQCQGKKRILRLTHSTHRSEEDVIAELDWINYLYNNGVKVSKPVLSRNGRFTEVIQVNDSYFIACVFERAPGDFINESITNEWNIDFFENWGRILGRMHTLTKKYDPGHLKKRRFEWQPDDLIDEAKKYMPTSWHKIIGEIEQLLNRIRKIPKTIDTFGLIHEDLNPTNFFVKDGKITIFDFDDCCYNGFISDIAMAIPFYSRMFETDNWEERFKDFFYHFIMGYNEKNRLDASLFGYLTDYLRLNNMNSVVFSFEIDEKNRKLYNAWFERVLHFYKNGHNLYKFDFQGFYETILGISPSPLQMGEV